MVMNSVNNLTSTPGSHVDEITIDPAGKQLFPVLVELERQTGFRVSPATAWRYRTKGVNGVKLECVLCGKRWLTTSASVSEFIRKQTVAKLSQSVAVVNDNQRDSAQMRRLEAAGLL